MRGLGVRCGLALGLWLVGGGCGTIGVDLKDLPFEADEDDEHGRLLDGAARDAATLDGDGETLADGGGVLKESDASHELGCDDLDPSTCDDLPEAGSMDATAAGASDGAVTSPEPDGGSTGDDDAGGAGPDAAGPTLCELLELPAAPLVHLPLDETNGLVAFDARGAHNGSLLNSTGSWTAGQVAGALAFDGNDDYVSVGNVGAAKSIALWLRADSYGVTSDQTGYRFPTATGSPKNQWTNPTLAYADDGQSSQVTGLLTGAAQDWSSFDLTVPSAITGIEVKLDMQSAALNLLANTQVTLSGDAGGTYSSACTSGQILSLGGTLYNCGNATDLWGRSWSANEVSNAKFRARVSYSVVLGTLFLDYLAVNVHYVPFTAGRGVLNLNASTHVTFSAQALDVSSFPVGTQVYVDGVLGNQVGPGFHHVVISSPSAIPMSGVEFGRALSSSPYFQGRLDEVRIYAESLTPGQIDALVHHLECAP
ncbi:MAG: hypothetical protein QM778_15055 [Myxococcales bacterium]